MIKVSTTLSKDQCFHCHSIVKSVAASNCTECQVVSYCSSVHQTAGWPSHEALCISIRQASNACEEELQKLQRRCDHCFSTEDAEPDHFWDWKDIRCYVQARRRLIDALCRASTRLALRIALYHCLDILRLNPCDNLDVKIVVPGIMIRLGMDVEAHEFIRRWRTISTNCQYAWAHLEFILPEYQPDKDTGNLASTGWLDDCMPLPFKVALVLLKLRLLLCLKNLENATVLSPILAPEIVRIIQDNFVTSAIANEPELWKLLRAGSSLHAEIAATQKQLDGMFEAIGTNNPILWPALAGSQAPVGKEVSACLEHCRSAWRETPGAREWVQERIRYQSIKQPARLGVRLC